MKRTIIQIFILIFLVIGAVHADYPVSSVIRTDHFLIIYYAPGHASTAERAGRIAEKWHKILSNKLGINSSGITSIFLYPDRTSFSAATGVKPGDTIVGLAHTRTLRVRVDASGAFGDIESVIPHELVHVFISRKLHEYTMNLPLWMHEGMAKYLADDWSGADAELLADTASGGNIVNLRELRNVFPSDSRKRSIAYVQSYSAVKFMADKYSRQSILDLLSEIADGRPFDTALRYSIGIGEDQFEMEWRKYLMDKYRFGRWINLWSGLVSAAMVLFAILAFRARRIHKRRKIEEMEDEDADGDLLE